MAIALTTIADSISKLSVTGVTIKDLDELPDEVKNRDCPLVIPAPEYVTNFKPLRVTYGSGSGAKWDVNYLLGYRFLYKLVGTERNLGDIYSGMVDKVMDFVDAIMDNDDLTGAVDITLDNITAFGVVEDPSGHAYHGCDITFAVLEFQD